MTIMGIFPFSDGINRFLEYLHNILALAQNSFITLSSQVFCNHVCWFSAPAASHLVIQEVSTISYASSFCCFGLLIQNDPFLRDVSLYLNVV